MSAVWFFLMYRSAVSEKNCHFSFTFPLLSVRSSVKLHIINPFIFYVTFTVHFQGAFGNP